MVDDLIIMDKKRKDRRKDTAEVFTPFSLCKIMADKLSPEMWTDPTKTFIDNCCGNGQIILYTIDRKLDNGSTYIQAISTVFGLDIMDDNISECKQRIKGFLLRRCKDVNMKKVDEILNHNIVKHDALQGWDYENWCPIKESKCEALF